jgi:alginate O-acetyltransferase complex protein AlgI
LYVPLGGNRGSLARVCRNLMVTMLLGGLWHGAAWNFVLWGFYQGVLLCFYRAWQETGAGKIVPPYLRLPRELFIIPFFFLVCYGWLLFRSQSLAQIGEFTSILFFDFGNLNYGAGVPRLSALFGIALLVPFELMQYWKGDPHYLRTLPSPVQGFAGAAMLLVILMGMSNEPAQFIYFQF